MANEGGSRQYWPTYSGVNLSNGNLHFAFGSTSCVTCGGGGSVLNTAANWTNFIHDELTENLLCEYTLITGTYTVKAVNTYGLGLISTNRDGTKRYFHFDGLGSTMHLTDASCAVTDSYTCDAFGNPLSSSGSSVNPYRYVGQWGYYDDGAMGSSSGMLLLGVRYYWPRYGRFTTWDQIKVANPYNYCDSSPAVAIDPTGLSTWLPHLRYQLPITGPRFGPRIGRLYHVQARLLLCMLCANRIHLEMRAAAETSTTCAEVWDNNLLRHCVWSCKVAKRCPHCVNVTDVKEPYDLATDWWSLGFQGVVEDVATDLWSNMVGRALASADQCTDACYSALAMGWLRKWRTRT